MPYTYRVCAEVLQIEWDLPKMQFSKQNEPSAKACSWKRLMLHSACVVFALAWFVKRQSAKSLSLVDAHTCMMFGEFGTTVCNIHVNIRRIDSETLQTSVTVSAVLFPHVPWGLAKFANDRSARRQATNDREPIRMTWYHWIPSLPLAPGRSFLWGSLRPRHDSPHAILIFCPPQQHL